jgi:hypothetical protein
VGKYDEAVHQLLAMPISWPRSPKKGFCLLRLSGAQGISRKALQELDSLLQRFPDWQQGNGKKLSFSTHKRIFGS